MLSRSADSLKSLSRFIDLYPQMQEIKCPTLVIIHVTG